MAFIPTPNAARVVIGQQLFGQSVSNTLWFSKGSPFTLSELTDLATDVMTEWLAEMATHQGEALEYLQVQAYGMESETAPVATVPFPAGSQGLKTLTPSLPGNVALVVKFTTANRGRSGRGRIYLSGLTEGDVDNNSISVTLANSLANALATIIGNVEVANGVDHCVVSQYTGGLARASGLIQEVTGMVVNLRVDTQRRRLG